MPSANGATSRGAGLDPSIRACLFDLDGVLTQTSTLHAEAWKKTFDTFLRSYGARGLRDDAPFDETADYAAYLEGRTAEEGIRAFLDSRAIRIPKGDATDAPGTETMRGIAAAEKWAFASLLEVHGPHVFESSVRYVRAVRESGCACAVVTSGESGRAVLRAAGIFDLFDTMIDGDDLSRLGLHGKPAPDAHLEAAFRFAVPPSEAAVFEDAVAGVEAGRSGGFGEVIGVDRHGDRYDDRQGERLRGHGATLVVNDLAELLETVGAER